MHFLPILDNLRLTAITSAHGRRVAQAMQARGLAPKSVRTSVGTLQGDLCRCRRRRPARQVPGARPHALQPVVRRRRPTFDAAHLERLAAAVPERYAALVLLAGVVAGRSTVSELPRKWVGRLTQEMGE